MKYAYSVVVMMLLGTAMLMVACTAQQSGQANQAVKTSSSTVAGAAKPAPTNTFDPYLPPTLMPTPQETEGAGIPFSTPLPIASPSPFSPKDKIEPALAQEMVTHSGSIRFYIMLSEQADLSTIPGTWDHHNDALAKEQDVAKRTQPAVKAVLDELKNIGNVSEYEAYSMVNSFYVKGDSKAIISLAERNDIKSLILIKNLPVNNDPIHPFTPATSTPTPISQSMQLPNVVASTPIIPWNIVAVAAPVAWAEGDTGTNTTIGIIDTGVDYTAPSLVTRFRGYNSANSSTPTVTYKLA